jgi:hypothetical protein
MASSAVLPCSTCCPFSAVFHFTSSCFPGIVFLMKMLLLFLMMPSYLYCFSYFYWTFFLIHGLYKNILLNFQVIKHFLHIFLCTALTARISVLLILQ